MNGFSKNWVPFFCSCTIIPMHFVLCEIFVIQEGLEIVGLSISGTISLGIAYCLLLSYQYIDEELKKSLVKFDFVSVFDSVGLLQFIMLAIPSLIIASVYWWIWEVYILLSGSISVND